MGFQVLTSLVEARLAERIGMPDVRVIGLSELSKVEERSQHSPAVLVIPNGWRPSMDANRMIEIADLFYTVIAVRNVRNIVSGADARAEAGTIMDEVLQILLGWMPDGYRQIELAPSPAEGYRNGFGYFPIAWRVPRKKFPMPCVGSNQ